MHSLISSSFICILLICPASPAPLLKSGICALPWPHLDASLARCWMTEGHPLDVGLHISQPKAHWHGAPSVAETRICWRPCQNAGERCLGQAHKGAGKTTTCARRSKYAHVLFLLAPRWLSKNLPAFDPFTLHGFFENACPSQPTTHTCACSPNGRNEVISTRSTCTPLTYWEHCPHIHSTAYSYDC